MVAKGNSRGGHQAQAKSQGGLPGSTPLRSDDSCDSQAGRLDHMNGGQGWSSESQKATPGSQGTYLKMGRVTAQKRANLLFLRDVEEVRG